MISISRLKPAVTPATRFATWVRDMPHCWRARLDLPRGLTVSALPTSAIVTSSVAVNARVPFGPFTDTVCPVTVAVTVQPFTYLWLLRDSAASFDERTERAIVAGLGLQLGEMGWLVKSLRARGEYVYVHAEVPGERPAYEVIDDLKRRAAEIAHAQEPTVQSDTLWADSYLVMMPGRELEPDEIDQFINFERMA